jgi:hypothetical protein
MAVLTIILRHEVVSKTDYAQMQFRLKNSMQHNPRKWYRNIALQSTHCKRPFSGERIWIGGVGSFI